LLLALRQSALAPALTYLALVAAVYASDAGPPVAAGTVTAVGLLPVCAWLARLVASAESAPFADITLLRLGGPARRQLIWWVSTMLVGAAFTVVAIVWARIANPHPYPARTVLLLVLLHLVQAACGAGLGGLLARPYPVANGVAVLVVTGVMVASLVVVQLPPVGPMVKSVGRWQHGRSAGCGCAGGDRGGSCAAAVRVPVQSPRGDSLTGSSTMTGICRCGAHWAYDARVG